MKKKFIFFIKKCLGEKLYLRIKGYLIINYNNTYMWSFLVGKPNSLKYQKLWSKFYLKSDDKENFSSAWGKIDQYNEGQGDYRIVLKKII